MTNEELKGILNHCLNDAILGRDRLRGTICSNDIAEFINEWLPKQLSLGTVVQAKPELCSCGRKKNRYWQFCKRCHYTHEFHRKRFGAE